ncbi:hypothetical protein KIPB_012662, partial [Kipferlia bialata]|eukprot:g12662.t1
MYPYPRTTPSGLERSLKAQLERREGRGPTDLLKPRRLTVSSMKVPNLGSSSSDARSTDSGTLTESSDWSGSDSDILENSSDFTDDSDMDDIELGRESVTEGGSSLQLPTFVHNTPGSSRNSTRGSSRGSVGGGGVSWGSARNSARSDMSETSSAPIPGLRLGMKLALSPSRDKTQQQTNTVRRGAKLEKFANILSRVTPFLYVGAKEVA